MKKQYTPPYISEYSLSTKRECKTLLNLGYTLENITGARVHKSTITNKQIIKQTHIDQKRNKRKKYNFNNPMCWRVVCPKTGLAFTPQIPIKLRIRDTLLDIKNVFVKWVRRS